MKSMNVNKQLYVSLPVFFIMPHSTVTYPILTKPKGIPANVTSEVKMNYFLMHQTKKRWQNWKNVLHNGGKTYAAFCSYSIF